MSRENIKQTPEKKGVSKMVNVRIPHDDVSEILKAAEFSGLPFAAFIRMGALRYAREVNQQAAH